MTIPATDPDGVRIRQAERADLFDVVRIEKASFPQPWPFHAFERFVGESGFLVAVADPYAFDGPVDRTASIGRIASVVGYVVADTVPSYGGDIGHVKDFAVHPEHRRRGIGTRLFDRALSTLAARGVRRAKLEVRESNGAARTLYRRFGFAPDHAIPAYYDDGEDALVLVADLNR